MNASTRIVVNTLSQYVRAAVNAVLSLVSVRIVIDALGKSDYGIYMLVAGVVALLGFITNALVITTQRHLSYYYGKGDKSVVKSFFSNSLFLHITIAFGISIVMYSLKDFLFESFLNIPDDRRTTASNVYLCTVIMLFTTFIAAPFKALFIARENIVYISVVEILDGILKLVLALSVLQMEGDKLLIYGIMMLSIIVFQFFAFGLYAMAKFEECKPLSMFKDFDMKYLKQLTGFAGWTTYGMASVVVRTQGFSMLLNHFCGTILNASYGIAQQVYSSVSFVSTSVLNAMNPQIMQAEGKGDRKRMFHLAMQESRFVSSMMAVLFVPLMFNINEILSAWINDVPEFAGFVTNILLLMFLVDQLTYGLNTANQAIGRIRNYTILIYTPKLLSIPATWCVFYFGGGVEVALIVLLVVEALAAMIRLPYLHYVGGLSITEYVNNVFRRVSIVIVPLVLVSFGLNHLLHNDSHFLIKVPIEVLFGGVMLWFFVLSSTERVKLKNMIISKMIRR